jgi:hypothetical protein
MKRFSIAAGAGIIAVVVAATIATSGSAQTAKTLHIVDTSQNSIGFGPNHQPRQGDRFGFGSKISGDATGYDRGICTAIGRSQAVCTVQVTLSDGTLTAQGTVSTTKPAKDTPFAITGGTGAYNGARGSALVNDVSKNKSTVDITLI